MLQLGLSSDKCQRVQPGRVLGSFQLPEDTAPFPSSLPEPSWQVGSRLQARAKRTCTLLLGSSTKEQTGCPKADAAAQELELVACSSESWAEGSGVGTPSRGPACLSATGCPMLPHGAFPCLPLPRLLPTQGGSAGPWLGCRSPAPSRGMLGVAGAFWGSDSQEGAVLPWGLSCRVTASPRRDPLPAGQQGACSSSLVAPRDQVWWQAAGSLWGSLWAEGGGSQCPCWAALSSAEPLP